MKGPTSIEEIRRRMNRHQLDQSPLRNNSNRAAVALVLAGSEEAPSLCLIRRAERDGDPWSGQMAFPGGREEKQDKTLQTTAERETEEEVGLRLDKKHFISPLAATEVRLWGKEIGMTLFSFVYYLGPEKVALNPNNEVAEAYWISLSHLLDPKNGGMITLAREDQKMELPSIRYGEDQIWGLTYRIFTQFTNLLEVSIKNEG